jgi:hypothetical protein
MVSLVKSGGRHRGESHPEYYEGPYNWFIGGRMVEVHPSGPFEIGRHATLEDLLAPVSIPTAFGWAYV